MLSLAPLFCLSTLLQAPAPELQRAAEVQAAWIDPALVVVDGNPSEWSARLSPTLVIDKEQQLVDLGRPPRELWNGPSDASVRVWLGWNDEDLILGGSVLDELADHDAVRWYSGDSLELFLSFGERAAQWTANDHQLMLAPAWQERPWGVYDHQSAPVSPGPSDGGFGGVEVASTPILGGYRFEARIPWRNFVGFEPSGGSVFGLNFALCDRDGRGVLETYATWTGAAEVARFADRRREVALAPQPATPAQGATSTAAEPGWDTPSVWLLGLTALYGIALYTRAIWRRPRARRILVSSALALLLLTGGIALFARYLRESEREACRSEVELYGERFARLFSSLALGHPEPDEVRRRSEELLEGKSIAPFDRPRFVPLAPAGARLDPEERTLRRGIPYRSWIAAGGPDPLPRGLTLSPGESLDLPLDAPTTLSALHVVVQVSDVRAWQRAGTAQTVVLRVACFRGGQQLGSPLDLRHRQDLHLDEEPHRDHPGSEPAYYASGGRQGRVHADGLWLALPSRLEADRIVVTHVGGERSYPVQLVALSTALSEVSHTPAPGLRANAAGEWSWSEWRAGIEFEVVPQGRAPQRAASFTSQHALSIGEEQVAAIFLRDARPAPASGAAELLPLACAAALAPFLVALLAEWLAMRQRLRSKLALGFAVSSAVPLLALTLLLRASLEQEHSSFESERVRGALARAAAGLEAEQHELERDAERLLQVSSLRLRLDGSFPATSEDLVGPEWWGTGEGGVLRVLSRLAPDGSWTRLGSGPGWEALPKTFTPSTGLWRPWGKLLVCGVAQTPSGAESPLFVLVAREARLWTPGGGSAPTGSTAFEAADETRLVGAGRDPAPRVEDLRTHSPNEVRRALFSPGGELAAVLVATKRERGLPVIGRYSLTELLFAAGLTAVFTTLLFAGILTGRLVGPIEALHRAVRAGRGETIDVDAADEVGDLAVAIRSYTTEIKSRVLQLETLRDTLERLSRVLDQELARESVIELFTRALGARVTWILWRGEPGEEPRVFGAGGRNLPFPSEAPILSRCLTSGEILLLRADDGSAWTRAERVLLEGTDRALALPLLAGGECRGAILLGLDPAAPEPDQAFLQAAAGQVAIALENARLYSQAVRDALTGFLSDPAFRQRFTEEIQRAEALPRGGVLVIQLRLNEQPLDETQAALRIREAARRMRAAVRGMAVFGRSGAADLLIALPWTDERPNFDAQERRLADKVTGTPWPDGEEVRGVLTSHAAWPDDGASARLVLHALDERLSLVQSAQPEETLDFLREHLPADFVAGAPIMVEVLDTLRRVAEQDVTVLVSGETGTGKDRVAELIHRWSPRVQGPLVHIHCPSLSANLIEDELFGHEVGAFSGATSRRMGPFEYARGGTIVLDEVAGLPPEGQVALLRLVESRQVLPLGSTVAVPIDVRIVATTSTDLAGEVQSGRFRSDLYFRLNVAQISVPPLRQRKQALPELVDSFVRRFNTHAQRPVIGIATEVFDLLFEHDWPGNLRELGNVLSAALIQAQGGELRREHVQLQVELVALGGVPAAELNQRQRELLARLTAGELATSTDHSTRHSISARTALRDLLDLVELGYLLREGQKRGTRFRRSPKAWRPG